MATAEQFLVWARAQLGVKEQPAGSNCNPYSHKLGRPCEPWCLDGLIVGADETGVKLPSRSGYTPTMADAFKKVGRWSAQPSVGAWAFWDFPDKTTGIQHVSVVESFDNSNVTSIDFNSSDGGSQDNGGEVVRRTRTRKWVVGYGLPVYTATPSQPAGGWSEHPKVEVDVAYRPVDVTISTDDKGNGWQKVPYLVDQIIGCLGPGLRPDVDGRYLGAEVGFAPEGPGTKVSVVGWAPNTSCVVRLRVAA